MIKLYTSVFITALLFLVNAANAQAPAPDPMVPKHYIYVEFAGNSGDRLSLNYEYAIWRQEKITFTARAGVFYMHQKEVTQFKVDRDAGDMIFGISTIYNGIDRHRLETGLAVNVRWEKLEGITDYLSNNLFTANIGYRLLPKGGRGFMFKADMMLITNAEYNWLEYYVEGEKREAKVMPWAGISVGYAF